MDFSVQKGVQRRYERIQGIIGVIIIGLFIMFIIILRFMTLVSFPHSSNDMTAYQ